MNVNSWFIMKTTIYIFVCQKNVAVATSANYTEDYLLHIEKALKAKKIPKLTSGIPLTNFTEINNYNSGLHNQDLYLNFSQLVRKYGFPVETHHIHTSDGYILTMFRIPCGGPPVFLMHGLVSSADDFIIAGPKTAIGYSLAYEGYDIWLGNARGNKYSRKHEVLSPDTDPKFWDFSWHEIGIIDIPTMIDYVLNCTRQNKLMYAGHSQGTTSFLVMCSERPEYNKKISVMIALSPVIWMSHVPSPVFQVLAPYSNEEYFITRAFGLNELLPNNGLTKILISVLCGDEELAVLICSNIAFTVLGFDYAQLNVTNLPNIYHHTPAGSSTKQLIHYLQEIRSRKFRKFDYGEKKNLEVYGRKAPPSYPVYKVSAPVAIFYSDNDWLASVTDVKLLRRKLPNIISFYRVPFKTFNHFDYLWGKDSKRLVFNKLSKIFKQYKKSGLRYLSKA